MTARLDAPSARIQLDDIDVAAHYGAVADEVRALRSGVAISCYEHMTRIRISGPDAMAAVDRLCPLDLFLRDGQLRQTLLLNEDATPLADVTLACDDESWLLLCEGAPSTTLIAHIRAEVAGFDVEVTDLAPSHALLSLNGPFAWELMAALEGEQVIAFPYLSFYVPRPGSVYFRAGKTGEFGYDLLIPRHQRDELLGRIGEQGDALDLVPAGVEALWQCALENWFFNIHREGRHGLTPIELGLQWRISYDKEYLGSGALRSRRAAGPETRLTALASQVAIASGAALYLDRERIGSVLSAEYSHTLQRWIGAGLLRAEYAYSGVTGYRAGAEPDHSAAIETVSAPFVNNLSLYVNPQQHRFADKRAIAYPGPDRRLVTAAGG